MFFAVNGESSKTFDNTRKEMISGITELNNNNLNKTEVNRCPYIGCNTVFPHLHLHNSENHLASPPVLPNTQLPPVLTYTSSSPDLPTIEEEEIEITSMEPPSKKHRLFQVHSSGVLVNPNIEIVDSLDCENSPEKQPLPNHEHPENKKHGFLSKVRQLVGDFVAKTSNAELSEPESMSHSNTDISSEQLKEDTEITADDTFSCHLCRYKTQEFQRLKCHYQGRHPSVELPEIPEPCINYHNQGAHHVDLPDSSATGKGSLPYKDEQNLSVDIKPRLTPAIRTRSQSHEKSQHVEIDGKF